jgi:hypothetical protein
MIAIAIAAYVYVCWMLAKLINATAASTTITTTTANLVRVDS